MPPPHTHCASRRRHAAHALPPPKRCAGARAPPPSLHRLEVPDQPAAGLSGSARPRREGRRVLMHRRVERRAPLVPLLGAGAFGGGPLRIDAARLRFKLAEAQLAVRRLLQQ
eukprot:3101313-Prymnesium_polylepis.1